MLVVTREFARRRLAAGLPLFPTSPRAMTQLRRVSRNDASTLGELLGQIETYCMFIGEGASGHSLTGSLLDAHPEIAIAHELDALAFVEAGFDFSQIVWLVMCNAATYARIGRRWREFDYSVPGQWQGRVRRLRVVGDKKAGTSARTLRDDFSLLHRFETAVPVRIRYLHVMRNPFDNIAAMALKWGASPGGEIMGVRIAKYLRMHGINRRVIETVGEDCVCNSYYEAMIADPKGELARICRFLGVSASEDYLAACAPIVSRSPRLSRHKLVWKPDMVAALERRLAGEPLLAHYRYEVP